MAYSSGGEEKEKLGGIVVLLVQDGSDAMWTVVPELRIGWVCCGKRGQWRAVSGPNTRFVASTTQDLELIYGSLPRRVRILP